VEYCNASRAGSQGASDDMNRCHGDSWDSPSSGNRSGCCCCTRFFRC
jgi:hypothetical protein